VLPSKAKISPLCAFAITGAGAWVGGGFPPPPTYFRGFFAQNPLDL